MGPQHGLRYHQDEQHGPRCDIHLLDVLRPHRAHPQRRQALLPTRSAVAAHEHAVQGRPDLLLHRVCMLRCRPHSLLTTMADSFLANLLATVFMLLNLNSIMSVIFNVPAAVASTVSQKLIGDTIWMSHIVF